MEETEGQDSEPSADSEGGDPPGEATEGQQEGESDPQGEGTPGEEEALGEPARGVTIARVDANSGVAIPVALNGQWVAGAERNAPLPKNRNTAFRVFVDVNEDIWVEREIEARMTVTYDDGSEEVFERVESIGRDSSTASLQSNIVVGVPAEFMLPGAKFNVHLYEAGEGYEGLPEVEDAPAAMPEPELLGVETAYANMRIVIVPVDYRSPTCNARPDISDERLQEYEDAMFQQNPLESIELELGDDLVVDDLDLTESADFQRLMGRIGRLRAIDDPGPEVYYYGLFNLCGGCVETRVDGQVGCTLGQAAGITGASQGQESSRYAAGTDFAQGRDVGVNTFVHEVGHTQGRQHVTCPGRNAAGPDLDYPHAQGRIGTWGFGVRDLNIRNSTTHYDYMSYCEPVWVSDWQWTETFRRIRQLSTWEAASIVTDRPSYVLSGLVNPETGDSQWWTARGWVDPALASDDYQVRFDYAGHPSVTAEAVLATPLPDGPGLSVLVPLPEDFDSLDAVTFEAPTVSAGVGRSEIYATHTDSLRAPL